MIKQDNFHSQIVEILQSAKQQVLRAVNKTMVVTYFEIGRRIVEEEQNGYERAGYGKSLLKDLSKVLTCEFGKGFSETNLKQMRQFYTIYQKGQTLSDELENSESETEKNQKSPIEFNLSWLHYIT